MIHVQPTPQLRRAFAVWATAQTPKVRTVGTSTFAVPPHLFTDVPEPVLIGATVDGHRYVSPLEDEQNAGELLGVATAAGFSEVREAVPGEPLPEVPAEAYGPDSTPLPAPDPADEPADLPDGVFPCPGCDKEFTTERGRDAHRRQKHPED
ncbi:hypothetical protein VSR01_17130 [Actinacidiphila sp. DG2A-62]|uniref:hypothetical protein n=1 Tax=Actinacidiphila sp. DG2A-62 TaxID=3108821 RepID=UPI002DB573BA|nr:hypothetical protein [Actinacidiphila sp. DG2A-62]MEC3995162.1 hypothetical protein [Actinacidiphila sp. DG2A-62]